MAERGVSPLRRHRYLSLVCASVIVGLASMVGVLPVDAASTTSSSGPSALTTGSATTTTVLTLALWQQRYEHDIGILADDVLVVVDDGKRAQHVTKAKVKTTVKDCRTWASDAAQARTAAPPIPMADAERAWTSMIATSALGAADCLAALQHGSRRAAKDFQKRVKIMQQDEATLTNDLGGS